MQETELRCNRDPEFQPNVTHGSTTKKVDGGILFVKRYTPDGLLPFKIQTMEPDELDVTRMTPKNKNNRVVGGIEYNSYNKPIGYFSDNMK